MIDILDDEIRHYWDKWAIWLTTSNTSSFDSFFDTWSIKIDNLIITFADLEGRHGKKRLGVEKFFKKRSFVKLFVTENGFPWL
jgi:hypothetical protein